MQLPLTVLGAVHGSRADVLVTVEDGDTVADVAGALADAVGPGETAAVVRPLRPAGSGGDALWADGRPLAGELPAAAVLRDGMVVALDPRDAPATGLAEPSGVVEVRVAGGPAAGPVHRLGLGRFELGGDPGCAVPLGDPAAPPRVAALEVGPSATTLEPAPGVRLALDGEPVQGPVRWPEGGILAVGATLLALHRPEPADASLTPTDDGGLAYNRPPRLLPPRRARRLVVPQEPRKGEGPRFGLLAAVLPAVFGAALAFALRQPLYLAMALLGPLTLLASYVSERRSGRRRHGAAMKDYQEARRRFDAELEALRAADEAERRHAAPDPAGLLLVATGPRRRLWERRADDPDALVLRVGAADLPAAIQLEAAAPGGGVPPPPARNVPVPLDLRELGVVGVAGPRSSARGLVRWLLAQAAVLHSPRDLELVLLAPDPAAAAEWDWLRWLPHARPGGGRDCLARVGTDPDTVARRVAELVEEVARRRSEWAGMDRAGAPREPDVLVVLDGARALRRVPGMPQVLAEGPLVGVRAICVDDDERLLPEECRTVAGFLWEDPARLRLRGGGLDPVGAVLADQVGVAWCERVARALAPVRDVSRDDAGGTLPDSARLLDLLGMPDPDAEQVAAAWARGGRTTAAPLGYGRDGPFELDLRRDGPHALVAGTTGAGKSELLQTLIASLAVANRPDAMSFVLIDYKGGSAFKDCARLPHTVGMVTDLDGHLTQRALASLSAELKRREELLLHAGAKDIEDYWTELRRGLGPPGHPLGVPRTPPADSPGHPLGVPRTPPLEPLPRLVLIIDEFASLVAELPEFVAGLVGIAQRGRSLGVHLVLATQRPAGVVSADIRANTNLRIALRVTDAGESADVIDAPDAAGIARSTPGRCYVRAGASTLSAVQTARVGGRRPGAATSRAGPVVARVGWGDLGRPQAAGARPDQDDDARTDLSLLVEAIGGAAARLGLPAGRSPWLPPLPEVVTLAELPRTPPRPEGSGRGGPGDPAGGVRGTPRGCPGGTGVPRTVGAQGGAPVDRDGEVPALDLGLVDVPAEQRRRSFAVDLAGGGHLLVAGSPRSGRSTVLRSLAGAIAAATSPDDVHLYGLDCGGNALLPLVGLPHCGAIVGREQPERVDRLLGRLLAEVSRRQQLLAEQGASSLAEQRAGVAPAERLPWMVLLLDRWEGFMAAFEDYDLGRLVDAVLRLLREGPAVGLRAVVTSDASGFVGQVSAAFEQRLVLRFADPDDWSRAGIPAREVPSAMPPGRGLLPAAAGVLEVQVGLLDRDPSGPAQVAALQALAAAAAERHAALPRARRPLRVDALPVRVTAAEALGLDPELRPPSPLWALLGAGGDALGPVGVDLLQTSPGFVVGGPPRSGRSTVLETMARSLTGRGIPVVLVTPRRSPLRELALPGMLGVVGADDEAGLLGKLLDGVERYVVLVDDAELLLDTPLDDRLGRVVRAARDADQAVVAAGTTGDLASQYRGFVVDVRRSRSGLLLSPQSQGDGDLLGVRLPRNMVPGPLGRGLLVLGGAVTPVQAALPDR